LYQGFLFETDSNYKLKRLNEIQNAGY